MKKNVRENDNKIITELILPDGLKITNIAKKHGDNAYEWVNWFENSGTEATQIISDIWDCDYVVPFEKDKPLGWVAYEPDREKVMKVYAPVGSQWTGYEFYANPDKTVGNGFQSYIFRITRIRATVPPAADHLKKMRRFLMFTGKEQG